MTNVNVGARILNIITESLYDKPIVVFREYVQNSVDSFQKIEESGNAAELVSKVRYENNNLYFLDNGFGIPKELFLDEMRSIAHSKKQQAKNIGYKGIGRLSGLPYCDRLIFINICSYKKNLFQKYLIDGLKYNQIKAKPAVGELSFEEMMDQIGTYTESLKGDDLKEIKSILSPFNEMFKDQDTGFLVILENITNILSLTIGRETEKEEDFIKELGWLLPVKFKDELFETKEKDLFKDLMEPLPKSSVVPVKAYNISFNDVQIERPIKPSMLRDYTCKTNIKYAVGFHSFNRDKIAVTRGNEFYGMKLYIDNILLCDEGELIPTLHRLGLIGHSVNELVQTVRGIASIIYITDKINISANARRTFIEVTNSESIEFLKLVAEFINNIYDTRYALSGYISEKNASNQTLEKLEKAKAEANEALRKLARDEIIIEPEENSPTEFKDMKPTEQKKVIKKKLSTYMNQKINDYLSQVSVFDFNNAVEDFKTWFFSNK